MNKLLSLALALLPVSVLGAQTYTYNGGFYNSFVPYTSCVVGPCTTYTTAMKLSGSFTTSTALAANLPFGDISSQVTSFSFSDGVRTYASTDPNIRVRTFSVSTDAAAQILSAQIQVDMWQSGTSPHQPGDRVGYINLYVGAGISGVLNDLACLSIGASSQGDVCATSSLRTTEGASQAVGPVGTWTLGAPASVPTLGEWGMAALAGLLMLYGFIRLRARGKAHGIS